MTILIIISALFLVACPVKSVQQEIGASVADKFDVSSTDGKNKPKIKDILGKERAARIAKARQITIYRIKEFVTDAASQKSNGKKFFVDYEIIASGKLNKRKSKQLTRNLLKADNYTDLNAINKCYFTATIGLEIITKKEKMNILVSYPCKKILFIENGQELYRDLESVKFADQIAKGYFKDLPKTN